MLRLGALMQFQGTEMFLAWIALENNIGLCLPRVVHCRASGNPVPAQCPERSQTPVKRSSSSGRDLRGTFRTRIPNRTDRVLREGTKRFR